MTEKEKLYDIIDAAKYLGFSQIYIRMLIRKGRLASVKKSSTPGSLVMKHMVRESDLNEFIGEMPHKTRRADGRNKFIMYATPGEYTRTRQVLLNANLIEVADLIIPANKVKFWED